MRWLSRRHLRKRGDGGRKHHRNDLGWARPWCRLAYHRCGHQGQVGNAFSEVSRCGGLSLNNSGRCRRGPGLGGARRCSSLTHRWKTRRETNSDDRKPMRHVWAASSRHAATDMPAPSFWRPVANLDAGVTRGGRSVGDVPVGWGCVPVSMWPRRNETQHDRNCTNSCGEIRRERLRGVCGAATAANKTGFRLNNMPEVLCRGACGTRCSARLAGGPHAGREMREST